MIVLKYFALVSIAINGAFAAPFAEAEALALPELPESAYTLDPSVPSIPELVELLDGDPSKLNASALERRAWVSDNNFRFYLRQWELGHCGPNLVGCGNSGQLQIIKRDNCNWNNCSPYRVMDNMKPALGFCNKFFSACRLQNPNTRWNLIIRKTSDPRSCQNAASIWLYGQVHLGTYGTLHDRSNGKQIGWCWYDKDHRYLEHCEGLMWRTDSLIRCGWSGF